MRAALAILATIVGVILLVSFKTPNVIPVSGLSRVPMASSGIPAASASPAATNGDGSPGPTTTPTAAAAGLRDGTFTGSDAPNQYGDVICRIRDHLRRTGGDDHSHEQSPGARNGSAPRQQLTA
jgi:hypothetical protein